MDRSFNMDQNSFGAFSRPQDAHQGKEKKMGLCGAPQCHCTPLLLALCIALAGLVLVGVGSCICGFMGNDPTPRALGASLIAIGFIMMIAGAAFFVYDTFYRVRFPVGRNVGYAYQPQESTQIDQPSTSYGSAAGPSGNDSYPPPKGHENVAPPAYDAISEPKSNQGGRTKPPLVV